MTSKNKILIGASLIALLFLLKPKKKKMSINKKSFVEKIYPLAKQIGVKIGVPPLFIMAQIALETRYGNSTLFSKYNNVGGIKAVKGQKFVTLPTKEDLNPGINDGKTKTVYQNFAVYPTLLAGMEAHAKVLTNRYFKQHANKTNDPVQYAVLLQSKQPKYATDDLYTTKIANQVKEINKLLLT